MTTSKQVFNFGQKFNGNRSPVFSWSKDSSYLAVGTGQRYVYVVDKRGKVLVEKQLPQKGAVIALDWDYEEELLAILLEDSSTILLWAPFTTGMIDELPFENQKQSITWMKWSLTHPVLACGNEKGYLNFYYKKNKRKVPTMGKHSKKVICGDWNSQGLLVTGSEDRLITISSHTSDNAANSLAVKAEPRDLKWVTMKTDQRGKKQTTICGVFNQKTLLIHDIASDRPAPLELMFESKYGKIIDYQYYGDGYIVIGFSQGYYCHVSTHEKEMKDEIKSQRVFNAPLEAMAVNNAYYKLALAGQNKIKVISLSDWKEIKQETFDLPPGSGKVTSLMFSPNGNTLTITTTNGVLYGYILSTTTLISTYNQLVALLSSLTEVVVLSCSSKKRGQLITNISLPFEPAGISLGPYHVAARLGNTIKFYRWLRDKVLLQGGEEVNEIQCEYNIKKVEVGDGWAAIMDDKNKIHLVQIEGKSKERIFPVEGDRQVVQFFMTKVFLIYLDNTYRLKYYHIEDKSVVMEHKPDNPILRVFPNKNGTKLILQHQNGQINLFFPTTESYHHVKLVTDRVDRVIWDNQNANEFVIINGTQAYSYVISKNNIFGNIVMPVNQILSIENAQNQDGEPTTTRIEKNVLTLSQGSIFFMTGITVSFVPLTSHAYFSNYSYQNDTAQGHTRYFFANLSLKRFQQCLLAAKYLRSNQFYQTLGKKALQNLDLDISLKSFQMGKNLAMVLTLEPLLHENEKDLLVGHVAMILGKYDIAQEHYLKSSEPLNALDMRCDIQDWFIASSLTKNIAPEQENFISKRLAAQTESLGNNTEALKQFEKSVINGELQTVSKAVVERHNVECFAGMARTLIKLGDIQRGFNIAREIKDKALLGDIAVVCENMKQYLEAAQIYDKAENFEKAATLYLQLKMFKQAAPLMKKVKSKAILIKYGKAKESEGAFKEAQQAYEDAEAWQDVVRINLNNFDNLDKPKEILRNKCSTSTVASIVANYCQKRGFWKQAVEFLIMANRKEQAFVMAQSHSEMDTYADQLKECTAEERIQIAVYYESKSMWDKAAKQYDLANNQLKSLKLYIKAGENYIDSMLNLIERNSSQEHLIQQLLDYLMGETDGAPKDPIFTYRLYRILKNFRNAAKIAVTIASQEQESGNYKGAHDILFQSYQDIKKANVPIPLELEKKLSILHAYIIAIKRVAKMDQHSDTALLLNKVSKNIIQFPAHAANILTTTIVKAMRADLKGLAYNWAIVVFRPEYKSQIPEKYVDKIKKVAMKPINQEVPEPKSPCPFCKEPVPDYNDDCPRCLNYIPFCIASGKHVVAEDLAQCNLCTFYCNYSTMKKMLEHPEIQKTCPMCNENVSLSDIQFVGESGVSGLKRAPPPKEESKQAK